LINDDDDAPDFSDLPPSQLLAQAGRFVPPKQISLVDAATSYSGLSHQSFALQTLDKQINDQLRTDFCARWMVGSQDLGLRPDETPDIISLEEAFHGYQPSQTPCQPVAVKWLEGQLAEVDLENFPNADYISRNHARVFWDRGQWKVEDNDSANGVFLKKSHESRFTKITTAEVLEAGDEVSFAKIRFTFQF
jgi:hypothetical protein